MAASAAAFLGRLHSGRQWLAFGAVALVLLGGVPALHLGVPAGSALHLPGYLVPLFGKFLCYVLLAMAMDLIWGYVGVLSLGQTVFFAAGGYSMGMYLMRSIGKEGVYR